MKQPDTINNNASGPYHIPVLLQETIAGLQIQPDGIYVDCTFGGGGHAVAILQQLSPLGKLIAFDQDADAKANVPNDSRLTFVPHNFSHLQRFLRLHNIAAVDGLLADLGVSSHQFNQPQRGFSTRFDSDLDMRMDRRQELTAYHVIANSTEAELHQLFEQYGEVTNAKTLAKTIVAVRSSVSLQTIGNFKMALQAIVRGNPHKYFAQVFQALRIKVNNEMGALQLMLEQLPAVVKPGGRIAIITFHSLEDRMVKQFFKVGSFEPAAFHPFNNNPEQTVLTIVTKKPIVPSLSEQQQNPRSRSAKLRIAERTHIF
jgi:16S rRNA (cytosine1402-N4)-methyltransferase